VPEHFCFAVKVPKVITHELRLKSPDESLHKFLREVVELGDRLGPLLVQLPPSLAYDGGVAGDFLSSLRSRHKGLVVCEPRHPSWFTAEADDRLAEFEVARVAADPSVVPGAAEPGGWKGLVYYRLHGSPTIYRSAYSPEFLDTLSKCIHAWVAEAVPVWCIFDNTAEGEAAANALDLNERLESISGA
jgi:uncharacterized protein YecE (DUF72 family)